MKYATSKECAITGLSLGTHGSAVSLIDSAPGSKPQHLSPEICSSFLNVLGRVNIPPAELYDPRQMTFDIGGLKRLVKKSREGDTVLRTIFEKFRPHSRARRFLMQNFGVSAEDIQRWEPESPTQKSASTVKRDSVHLH